ncbi:hypothetical protein EEL31_23840 [Brevibacillus laterosporus]|nr:phage head-tail connector protein [Brevibacillus laterosporus]TPG71163.1 hypothetical protein EEL31_23840 [Brevibacillus laterosporus]
MAYLSITKLLLKKTDSADSEEDVILQFYIDDVVNAIKVYCGLQELPDELQSIVVRKAIDLYQNNRRDKNIQSRRRGSVTTQYVTESQTHYLNDVYSILDQYKEAKFY